MNISERIGRYVRTRKRSDGTDRVFMSVPARYRPKGWSPTVELPVSGSRRGRLRDADFRRRVTQDAERLNARLDLRRGRESMLGRLKRKTVAELAEIYCRSSRFKSVSKARQDHYRMAIRMICDWSASQGHPDFATIFKPDIEDMLSAFDDRPFMRLEIRTMWNILSSEAIDAGWRSDHPARRLPWSAPKPAAVNLWQEEDVDRYSKAAVAQGQPGLGALIRVQFFIGQRLGDTRLFRHGNDYDGSGIAVKQSKVDERVGAPLPKYLRDLIESVRVPGSEYLFNDFTTGTHFTQAGIFHAFGQVRHAVSKEGDDYLVLRTLRHSAVCQMGRLGHSNLLIGSMTGHKFQTIDAILERYAVDRHGFARAAAVRRHVAEGGMETDFNQDDPEWKDRWGDCDRRPTYQWPWNKGRSD